MFTFISFKKELYTYGYLLCNVYKMYTVLHWNLTINPGECTVQEGNYSNKKSPLKRGSLKPINQKFTTIF